MKFTVLLRYPDHLQEAAHTETYLYWAMTADVVKAVQAARMEAAKAAGAALPEEFEVLFVCEGFCLDLHVDHM